MVDLNIYLQGLVIYMLIYRSLDKFCNYQKVLILIMPNMVWRYYNENVFIFTDGILSAFESFELSILLYEEAENKLLKNVSIIYK